MAVIIFLTMGLLYSAGRLFVQLKKVTELKRQTALQEEYIASILQNSVDAIVFIDNDNKVQVWNRGAEMIFGYTEAEMKDETFHKLIPADLDAEIELNRIWEEVKLKGYISDYITKRLTKNGRSITVDISRTLVKSADGKILGSTAIIKDITKLTEIEQRIYNAEKLASIGTLAAGVAHEINNPLGVILGFTELLLEKFDAKSKEYADLKVIEENSNLAKKIVDDLLGFARVSEGQEEEIEVKRSIETVLKIAKITLKKHKIDWTFRAPDTLPTAQGDTREFQQVIFNLINNSAAAVPAIGGRITITVCKIKDEIEINIIDNGIGIPERIKPHIFDPFFTTKEVGKGTGLGLSISYDIVRKHQGKITVESVPGQGAQFTVFLPSSPKTPILTLKPH